MPTKRIALLGCLALLAACTPRAADGGVAAADTASTGMPDLDELERARANAGCEVSNDIGDVDDIGIYCQMPADVRAFLERENTCQHFAGEEAYDAARQRELEAASAEFCDGREDQFKALYQRYVADCGIRHALIGVGTRYDLFVHATPQECPPQPAG